MTNKLNVKTTKQKSVLEKRKCGKMVVVSVSVSEKLIVFNAKKVDSEEEKTKFVVKKTIWIKLFSVTKYII